MCIFFLGCPLYQAIHIILISNISLILGNDILILPHEYTKEIILNRSNAYDDITNRLILLETLNYIRKSKRFVEVEAFDAQGTVN